MKKLVLLMMMVLGVNAASFATTTNTDKVYSNFDHKNKSIVLVEQGVEFIIYKNGSFDYAPLYRNNTGSSVNIRTRNGNTVNIATGGGGRQDRVNVSYDRRGRIARINNIIITYHRNNKVAQIGSAFIDYKGSRIYVNDAYHYNEGRYYHGHDNHHKGNHHDKGPRHHRR